ncbi:hypothetical protein EJB05_26558, partial [Eragrostis curvula]
MYAVGKVGSLISRSVYTVSGPFHPFGGAVDIVVVQQQDGSFKSSPWYVRFGKFQGVLKTREKVVNISVNGVDAGFHMYLDSNGEAYFLRDADPNAEEGEFMLSPASSGDEQEAPAQLRKSKSTSCDSSTMEADVGEGKILARTTTARRTTILGRMFGRKTVKDNAHAMDRVSSLERAEIAAELLDTKWSTNLSRGSRSRDSDDQPSKSIVADAGNSDQMETSETVLLEHSFDHGKESDCNNADCNSGSPHGGRSSSANETDHCVQTTSVKEEVVEVCTQDQPSKSIVADAGYSDQMETSETVLPEHCFDHGKEMESNCENADCNSGPHGGRNSSANETDSCLQITSVKEEVVEIYTHDTSEYNITSTTNKDLGTDCIHESVDTLGGLAHNFEDVTGREIHTKEFLSDGVFEIHAVKNETTNGNSELISQFVTGDSDGANQNYTENNLPTYGTIDVSTERHDISSNSPAQDVVEDKMVIISTTETVESYAMSSTLTNKVLDAADILLTDGVHLEDHSIASDGTIEQLISEEMAISEENKSNVVVKDHADSVLEDLQANGLDMENSEGTILDYHGTDAAHDLDCKYDDVCPNASSNVVEMLRYVPENIPEDVTKESTVEKEAYSGEPDLSVTQASPMGEGSRECIAQLVNFSNNVEMEEGLPIITDEVEAHNTEIEDDANRPIPTSGDEIGFVQETTAESKEETQAVVSFAEHIEEIQFQFSDTESFADTKVMDEMRTRKTADEGEYNESDSDPEEQQGCHTDSAIGLENNSALMPESSPLPIPGSELHSGDSIIGAKSLPNLRSHIRDLERSDSVQLSCSLRSNAENNGVEPVKIMSFPEQEPEATVDPEENSKAPELPSNSMPENKHTDDLKVDSFNPVAELSLCRHLLSEGMGEDAARRAFDSEKVSLEKFRTMKQSLTRNNKLVVRIAGRYFPWDAAAPIVLGMISFSEEQVFEPQGMIKVERVETSLAPGGGWRIWPFSFRRTRAISTIEPVCESIVETPLSTPVKEAGREWSKARAKKVRSLTPTSEELASLDLREGRNVVTFTFSTAMLGKQQVDCRIYLWKWNTRIVISDVDGTITKSDVLGQFMPLVGVDWSQNGVAHLFSAIKENGYQLLFLSARAISQAHLTRQFLFNLKQDGKALPDGPVVISPDGLFPSLYREVIRRAPHEFKISCLEAIRALFPPDSNPNPFYAGFGNRDTDELSYLKVGIPIGKIFIINPKGEVAVNRRVDTKSYTSLHALVNGMFPPISSSPEQVYVASAHRPQHRANFMLHGSDLEMVDHGPEEQMCKY